MEHDIMIWLSIFFAINSLQWVKMLISIIIIRLMTINLICEITVPALVYEKD